jgi:hypothetical protein
MMNKLLHVIKGLLLIMMFIVVSCSSNAAGEVKAAVNQEFRLAAGKTAIISGEDLKLKLEEVSSDSRCPQGVTCIWAGEAKCRMNVTHNQNASPLILIVSGSGENQVVFDGYTFVYNLEPYPQAGQEIDKNAYVLVMKITR